MVSVLTFLCYPAISQAFNVQISGDDELNEVFKKYCPDFVSVDSGANSIPSIMCVAGAFNMLGDNEVKSKNYSMSIHNYQVSQQLYESALSLLKFRRDPSRPKANVLDDSYVRPVDIEAYKMGYQKATEYYQKMNNVNKSNYQIDPFEKWVHGEQRHILEIINKNLSYAPTIQMKISSSQEKLQGQRNDSYAQELNQKMAPTINERKSRGDYVCNTNGVQLGYIENVSGDKIQIRIHHGGIGWLSSPDELIWLNYNETWVCN